MYDHRIVCKTDYTVDENYFNKPMTSDHFQAQSFAYSSTLLCEEAREAQGKPPPISLFPKWRQSYYSESVSRGFPNL